MVSLNLYMEYQAAFWIILFTVTKDEFLSCCVLQQIKTKQTPLVFTTSVLPSLGVFILFAIL